MKEIKELVVAIARLGNVNKDCIGYRIARVSSLNDSVDIKDVPEKVLKQVIANGMNIENLAVTGNQVVSTQGSIERLPFITLQGMMLEKNNNLTIAYEIGDVGYRVIGYDGKQWRVRTDELLENINNGRFTGLSNGKVVNRDGMQFVSAINGSFKTLELKAKAVPKIKATEILEGAKQQRVLSKTVSLQNIQVREEIEYNDTFKVLTPAQMKAIEGYYTWWTTKTFSEMTKSGADNLRANPKKMQQLSELRGKDIEWRYHGCIPAILSNPGNLFDYCSLGHKLQHVHTALGRDKAGNTYKIKFGITCVGDFFDISDEGVRKLQKVSNTMKDEIKLLVEWAEAKSLGAEMNNVLLVKELLDDMFSRKNTDEVIADLSKSLSVELAKFLVIFYTAGVPFPESLLKSCKDKILGEGNDKKLGLKSSELVAAYKFLQDTGDKEIANIMDILLKNSTEVYKLAEGYVYICNYIEYLMESKFEGPYGYNPFKKIGCRGKGKFTQEACSIFKRKLLSFNLKGLTNGGYNDLKSLIKAINSMNSIGSEFIKVFDSKVSGIENKEQIKIEVWDKLKSIYNTAKYTGDYDYALHAELIAISIYNSGFSKGIPRIYNIFRGYIFPRVRTAAQGTRSLLVNDIINYNHKDLEQRLYQELFKVFDDVLQEQRERENAERIRIERESYICTNTNCDYNTDGACKRIIENGIDAGYMYSDNNEIIRCDYAVYKEAEDKERVYSTNKKDDTGVKEVVANVDTIMAYKRMKDITSKRGILYNKAVKSIQIADDIVGKPEYSSDGKISFKQRNIMKSAIKHIEKELNNQDLYYDFTVGDIKKMKEEKFKSKLIITSPTEAQDTDDSENWQKRLDADPQISDEVKTVLDAIDRKDSRVPYVTAQIAKSVKKYNKISSKQYKHIKECVELLK